MRCRKPENATYKKGGRLMGNWESVFGMRRYQDGKRIEVRVAGGQVALGTVKAALQILSETAFMLE